MYFHACTVRFFIPGNNLVLWSLLQIPISLLSVIFSKIQSLTPHAKGALKELTQPLCPDLVSSFKHCERISTFSNSI